MSFGEKLTAIMQKPGQDPSPKDDVPWYLKYAGRGLGTVGSFIAIFLGVFNCAGILLAQVDCFLGGLWQMVTGFLVITIEAPCCCMFIDFVQQLSDWVDRRPYWNRAAAYCGLSLPAIFLCPGLGTMLGSGLIFATGVIYGMMSIGKKASRDDMIRAAQVSEQQQQQQGVSSSTKSNLVENAQPMGISPRPDSNV